MDSLIKNNTPYTSPIILYGAPRSGTTVIFEALSKHSKLGWFTNHYSRFPKLWWLNSLVRLKDFPLLKALPHGQKNQFNQNRSILSPLLPRPVEGYPIWRRFCGDKFLYDYLIGKRATEKEITVVRREVKRVLRSQKKQALALKLTGPSRLCYLNSLFPNAFFVHIVRDGRAVVCSQLNVHFWKLHGGFDRPWWNNGLQDDWQREWEQHGGTTEALAAMQWRRILEVDEEERALIEPINYLRIRYEDFIHQPKETINSILTFTKLPHSDAIDSFIDKSKKYNDMNKKYVTFFTPAQISRLETIMGKWLEKYGYNSDTVKL